MKDLTPLSVILLGSIVNCLDLSKDKKFAYVICLSELSIFYLANNFLVTHLNEVPIKAPSSI